MASVLTAEDVAATSFAVVAASWPADRARAVVDRLQPRHVVCVHRDATSLAFFLYTLDEFTYQLHDADETVSVTTALDLDGQQATPAVDAATPASGLPHRYVVHRDGNPIGYADVPRRRRPPRRDHRASAPPDEAAIPYTAANGEAAKLAEHALVAELPERLVVDVPASLLVQLTAGDAPAEGALPVGVAAGTDVHVVVQAKRGLKVKGPAEGALTVPDEGDSLPLRFEIVGATVGPAQVDVRAFVGNHCIGTIKLRPEVVAEADRDQASSRYEQQLAPAVARLPDLMLLILEGAGSNVRRTFDVRLTAADPELRLTFKEFGPIVLEREPEKYFTDFFGAIEELRFDSDQHRARARLQLEAKGAHLFETLFDEQLRALLWKLHEKITSVQIVSEEPWIPWELCKLSGTVEGRTVAGPFFGEAFAITRWITGIGMTPKLSLDNIAVVAAEDAGLPFAGAEVASITSLANAHRQVHRIPSNLLDVTDALASGTHDCWHFTGHGEFNPAAPDHSAIYLANDDPMKPENISGVVANLGHSSPLVFLNACQVGRGAMSLTRMGGWAAQFLHAGAGAFVGTYWSVHDEPAHSFARTFYEELLRGLPVGQAARTARRAINKDGDPTWMAYTVFADPYATVT
jgi:hypothetical protein